MNRKKRKLAFSILYHLLRSSLTKTTLYNTHLPIPFLTHTYFVQVYFSDEECSASIFCLEHILRNKHCARCYGERTLFSPPKTYGLVSFCCTGPLLIMLFRWEAPLQVPLASPRASGGPTEPFHFGPASTLTLVGHGLSTMYPLSSKIFCTFYQYLKFHLELKLLFLL